MCVCAAQLVPVVATINLLRIMFTVVDEKCSVDTIEEGEFLIPNNRHVPHVLLVDSEIQALNGVQSTDIFTFQKI